MALIIGVNKNSRILVGESTVEVRDILPKVVTLYVYGENEPREFLITDAERTEIVRDVFVSLGLNHRNMSTNSNRLAFEAPKSIKINRVRE